MIRLSPWIVGKDIVMRKTLRNQMILREYMRTVDLTGTAKLFGLSKQRIEQIVRQHKPKSTSRRKPGYGKKCARCSSLLGKNNAAIYARVCCSKRCLYKLRGEHALGMPRPRHTLGFCTECKTSFEVVAHRAHNMCKRCYERWAYHNVTGYAQKRRQSTRDSANRKRERVYAVYETLQKMLKKTDSA